MITKSLKGAITRTRPNESNKNSFPSGHTAATFSAATVANHYFGKKVGIPAFAAGAWVAAARIEDGKHFLSDVIIGATVGIIAGRTAIRGTERESSRRLLAIRPQVGGDRVGVVIRIAW